MAEFIVEFWKFAKTYKAYWLIPMLLILASVGALLVFSEGSVIAPFLYTLF